ncbi:phage portal protein [Micromonospora sp. WMMD1120]|uniref:phage portal protein n=1 Tax=Micromonospora sp. WMMD1120 TaxID=3016106 RepID=UPI0024160C68|nr:phage portal protein [Micromonospora sp. WMMD1120]MDG4809935.1 phage portal protein [Micromonospora sp. WMMD1120]
MGWLSAVGQQFRDLLSLPQPLALDEPATAEFDSPARPIDRLILEMSAAMPGRVSRSDALSVTAVKKGRNALCSVATLPLVQYRGLDIVRSPFLEQIDPDVANVVTLAQTIEDLAFDAISWWLITAQDFAGYPIAARHLDVATVSLDPPANQPNPFPSGHDARGVKIVWVAGVATPADKLIRFDSPNPGLLSTDSLVVKRALLLNRLATTYADNPRPLDLFTDSDDMSVDPMKDEEIDSFLADWKAARKRGSTAWVPATVKRLDVNAPSPAELQLVELQQQVTLEIANGLGVDPEDLGVSTTSRTYFNAQDRRTTKINETYAPYMSAITQRLSMGDVTRRGHAVRFDLTDYLKPDPAGQIAYWKGLYDMGAIDSDEVRAMAQLSGPAPKKKPAPAPAPPADQDETSGGESAEPEQVDAAAEPAGRTFDAQSAVTFDAEVLGFTVDTQRRTIEGLALPYGKTATKYGVKFLFEPGSLKWSDPGRVKLLRDHDYRQPLGKAIELTDTPRGLKVKFSVAPGAAGDEALALAEHGTLDGLSVGVDFDMAADTVPDDKNKGTVRVRRADLRETSITAVPAFDDARVAKVRAQRDGGSGMPDEHESAETQTTPPAAGGVNLNQDQLTALLQRPGAIQALVAAQQTPQRPTAPEGGLVLSAEQVDGLIRSGKFTTLLGLPQVTPAPAAEPEKRATVDPTRRTVTASVKDEMPYRFDRQGNLARGTHDFSTDLIAGSKGDMAALERAQGFMRESFEREMTAAQFDVDRADVGALNPNRNRPDMYVDQREYQYPVWSAVNKGTIADATPFVLPKFNSASGMVANHTEGTEPTPGAYTATSQTITPSAVSGKVEITREAWDQGGNPQLSGIIWRQMVRAWYESLEAAAVAVLDAATPTAIALTAGGGTTGQTLDGEITAAFAGLQYIRGGFSMDTMFTQIDLYKAMVAAKDTTGRRLYPALGPSNASGTASSRYAAIDVNGVTALPAWALAATGSVVASSYLFDREVVHGWATAPQRLEFQYRVAYVDLAIWGYKATAITDINGVREITYDPVP